MTAASIARLRIKLDDVEPAVVRRVEVPLTIRLDRLHLVLQAAMGWTNSHLYEIRAHDVGWGRPDPYFGDGPLDASKARLVDVLEDVGARSLKYLYDFGDGWEHSVRTHRAHHRCHARHRLPAPSRSSRTLPARRCRRALGIPRVPRCDR
jgi:pRiA4b ORF-3-like protein